MIETISKLLTTNGSNFAKPIILQETTTGCIECISHKMHHTGYLELRRYGGRFLAHRLVYEYYNGPILKDQHVCHHCDNPSCLNPEHFFLGTHADNMRDKAIKGRSHRPFGHTHNRGEKSGNAKLTKQKVCEIRRLFQTGKYTKAALSRKYNISDRHVGDIVRNKVWTHLKPQHLDF